MRHLLSIFFLASLFACSGKTEDSKEVEKSARQATMERTTVVYVDSVRITEFERQILGNGKLRAKRSAVIETGLSEPVRTLKVSEGDRVSKGALLGRIDDSELRLSLAEAERDLEKASVGLRDFMYARGYDGGLSDTLKVPKDVLRMGKIDKGYEAALTRLERAKLKFSKSVVRAPFAGVVADLAVREHHRPESGKPFCRIIDDRVFEIVFSVLESEVPDVTEGMRVRVSPFALSDREFVGEVVSVNPLVDENGLVRVTAELRNTDGLLREGMNGKVVLSRVLPNKLVVPKSSVVLRSGGRPVVFTLNGDEAKWNYVALGEENSQSYVLVPDAEGNMPIKPGDVIIVKGNLNLAHKAKVKVGRTNKRKRRKK
ncbi:cation efflux system protein [Fulvitalea axinellae]|uniref:Cation efflux system protein n=1 Tax=Fulvitalea axinellae TaxID=1182444 RepID=A0AAU9CYS6_9BACT|nr:cation efflux system protein [Fulvitalea axinellae]